MGFILLKKWYILSVFLQSKNRVQNFAVQNRCLKKLGKVLYPTLC